MVKVEASVQLPHDPTSPGRAREWAVEVLEAVGPIDPDKQAHLEVMVSELVANVIEHTDSDPHLTAQRDDRSILVEVADDDPHPPAVRPLDPGRVGGHGLRIISSLAERWGVHRRGTTGKAVWFMLGSPMSRAQLRRHAEHLSDGGAGR